MDDLLKNNNLITVNQETKNDVNDNKQESLTTIQVENNLNMVDNTKNKLVRKPSNYTANKELIETLILSIPEIGETLLKNKGKNFIVKYKDAVKGKTYKIILSIHDNSK